MSDAIVHRGPDGEGFWEGPANAHGFAPMFAHRRLSILDLSTAASQPMTDPVSGDVVILNGEIYNYATLRSELASQGQRFQSSGDTAVMLRALSLHGQEAVASLRGMFAFAYWDTSTQELMLARDSLGIKPLYLVRNPDPHGDWSIAFASEVRALLASGLLTYPRLDPVAVASVVWNGFTVGPGTAIEGIETLWPGEYRVFDSQGREARRRDFWSAKRVPDAGSSDEREVEEALHDSVRLHLATDVPLGVFLSGGVDSSAVANLAQKAADSPIHTFTLAFAESEHSEGPIAHEVAQAIGTQHHELVLTEQHFLEQLDTAMDSLDQPSFDGLNTYFMSRAVRDAGFTVALIGSGGDELFGGYTSFRDLPLLRRWSRRMSWVPSEWQVRLADSAARGLGPKPGWFPPQTRWAKLATMVSCGQDLMAMYQVAYALFLPAFQDELLRAEAKGLAIDGLPPEMKRRLMEETHGRSDLSAISVMEQRLFLGERLLRDTDSASMAASIETRLPLVDQVLLQHVDRLPDQIRYHPVRGKHLLRRLGLKGLDAKLFDRPKSGFELPYDRWLKNRLKPTIDVTLRDRHAVATVGLDPDAVAKLWRAFSEGQPGLYWSRIWAIFVLVRWCQRHGIGL